MPAYTFAETVGYRHDFWLSYIFYITNSNSLIMILLFYLFLKMYLHF